MLPALPFCIFELCFGIINKALLYIDLKEPSESNTLQKLFKVVVVLLVIGLKRKFINVEMSIYSCIFEQSVFFF